MILRTLKSNSQINLFLVPVIGILFWVKNLIHPVSYEFVSGEKENILFSPIFKLLEFSPLLQVILSLVLISISAVLMQMLNTQFAFIRIRTKLTPVLFVIIIAGFTELHTLHPVHFAVLFLLFALYNLFDIFEKPKSYGNIFNAGFLLGIGSLFYVNLIFTIPAFIIGLSLLSKEINWRNYIIFAIGIFVPVLFAFSYAVLSEQTMELLEVFRKNIISPGNQFKPNIALYVLFYYLILLTVAGSVKITQQYDSKKISTRKYFLVFLILFISTILSYVLVPGVRQEMLIIATIPVTYLVSNYFVFMNKKVLSEVLFILLLLVIVFMQVSDKFLLNG